MEGFIMSKIKMHDELTFLKVYDYFQAFNRSKNLSESTLRFYQSSRDSVVGFMNGDFNISDFDIETLTDYIQHLRGRGNRDISINSRLRGLRTIFNFYVEREYGKAINIKMIKAVKPIKEIYSDAELQILLKKPNKTAEFDDYRNWVIINYILACGSRLSTIINIRMRDINLEQQEIILRHTKNKTQQVIPMASALKSILIEYIRYRKPKSDDDYLFCNWHGGQLSRDGLINGIRRYNRRRGVEKTSIHLFRHTFATLWLRNNGNIFTLQRLLGHSSLDMVKNYLNQSIADIQRDYDIYNPLQNIQKREHLKMKK